MSHFTDKKNNIEEHPQKPLPWPPLSKAQSLAKSWGGLPEKTRYVVEIMDVKKSS